MKSLTIILLFFVCFTTAAQDVIITKTEDNIEAKVEEIGIELIKYRKHDNLNGPVYYMKKTDISKIIFKNGSIETFDSTFEIEELSINKTKAFIKENMDKYCYNRSGEKSIKVVFEEDFLRIYWTDKEGIKKDIKKDLLDLSSYCNFHTLAKRGNDLAYINAYIPRLRNKKKDKWGSNYKLIIQIRGHEKGELILNALKHYNALLLKRTKTSN